LWNGGALHEKYLRGIGRIRATGSECKNMRNQLQEKVIESIQKYADLILPINSGLDDRYVSLGNCMGYITVYLKARLYGRNPFGIRSDYKSPFSTISKQADLQGIAQDQLCNFQKQFHYGIQEIRLKISDLDIIFYLFIIS
jgi:hypothetical protein